MSTHVEPLLTIDDLDACLTMATANEIMRGTIRVSRT